ncbi:MAG: DUF3093 domain-containing protein [Actinomycetota bacterium]
MQNNAPEPRPHYRERLAPSLWLLVSAAVAGPMVSLVFVPIGSVLALVLGVLAALLVVFALVALSPVIEVDATTLRAGRAHIDARWLGEPETLVGPEAAHARGPGLPARGWHLIRGGVDGIVVVPNLDPDDPVPTWTISSRTPDRLSAAISAARTRSAAPPR